MHHFPWCSTGYATTGLAMPWTGPWDHVAPKTPASHITQLITMLRLAASLKVPWLVRVPRIGKPKARLCSRDYR